MVAPGSGSQVHLAPCTWNFGGKGEILNLDLQGNDWFHFFTNVFGNLLFLGQTELRALWEAVGFFKVRAGADL